MDLESHGGLIVKSTLHQTESGNVRMTPQDIDDSFQKGYTQRSSSIQNVQIVQFHAIEQSILIQIRASKYIEATMLSEPVIKWVVAASVRFPFSFTAVLLRVLSIRRKRA